MYWGIKALASKQNVSVDIVKKQALQASKNAALNGSVPF